MFIYASHISPRFQYIVNTLLGKGVLITDSKEKFLQQQGFKINYSNERLSNDALFIQPHVLLFEENIQYQKIDCFEWNGVKVFFKTDGDIPFDIFAAAFYLISRYEEYLPHELDMYGRYNHANSLAYKENFLQLPLINLWLKELTKINSVFNIQHSTFNFIPTYDIDIAYAYLHQPFFKNLFGFYSDLFKFNFEKFTERSNVYSGWKKDPYDTYDWLDALHQQYHLQPIYFFLCIIERGEYDKNILIRSKAIQKLYQSIADKYSVGIHPSWKSAVQMTDDREQMTEKKSLIKSEIGVLKEIIQQDIVSSRQHYLRFTLPDTYRQLIALGMKHEYAMGYGSINGFRASYALPFYWFDLQKNKTTELMVHPFCYMEANSFFEQKYSAEQAREELQHYHDIVKSVNGELITIFHNHFITEQPQWIEWRNMYADFLEKNYS